MSFIVLLRAILRTSRRTSFSTFIWCHHLHYGHIKGDSSGKVILKAQVKQYCQNYPLRKIVTWRIKGLITAKICGNIFSYCHICNATDCNKIRFSVWYQAVDYWL